MGYWNSKIRADPGKEVLNEVLYPNCYYFSATVLVPPVYKLVLSHQSLCKITAVMMQGRAR